MKSLQMKYDLLHVLFFLSFCTFNSFSAIMLGYKGLSSTMVGLATGGACLVSVVLTPMFSMLLARSESLSITRLLGVMGAIALVGYAFIGFLPLSPAVMIAVYAIAHSMFLAGQPFLSQLAMDFARASMPVNFGVARGLGSLAYALTAVVLSPLVELFNPLVLVAALAVSVTGFFFVLHSLPTAPSTTAASAGSEQHMSQDAGGDVRSARNAWAEVFSHRALILVIAGFTIAFVATNCLTVYLVDVVTYVGGNTTLYGVAVFCMAASELPAMAIVPRLRRRFSAGTLFIVAGVAYLIRNFLVVCATNVQMVFFGLMFQSMSYGMLTSLLAYYISEECGPSCEMEGQTLLGVATAGVGSMVGTVCGGVIQDSLGMSAMLGFVAVSTVLAALVLFAAGASERRSKCHLRREPLR